MCSIIVRAHIPVPAPNWWFKMKWRIQMANMLVQNLKQNSSLQAHHVVGIVCVCTFPLHHVMGMLAKNVDIHCALQRETQNPAWKLVNLLFHIWVNMFDVQPRSIGMTIFRVWLHSFHLVIILRSCQWNLLHPTKFSPNFLGRSHLMKPFRYEVIPAHNPYTCLITCSPINNLQ